MHIFYFEAENSMVWWQHLQGGDLDLKKRAGERHLVEKIHNKTVKQRCITFKEKLPDPSN